jgi:hypothetical protein
MAAVSINHLMSIPLILVFPFCLLVFLNASAYAANSSSRFLIDQFSTMGVRVARGNSEGLTALFMGLIGICSGPSHAFCLASVTLAL